MRSYLEANSLPTVRIGQAELPCLIMGIHPYDGCSYVDSARDQENLQRFDQVAKVSKVLRYAVEEEGLTVVQGDHMIRTGNFLIVQRPPGCDLPVTVLTEQKHFPGISGSFCLTSGT